MSRTYDFVIDLAQGCVAPPARLLDFGCGAGQIVKRALRAGYDAQGADLFEGVWDQYREAARVLGKRLHVMPGPDKLPFDDASFDIAVSNQVFEHIENKAPVIAELARVIKPGGVLITVFPTREVIVEPHLKAPFAHWFTKNSPAQSLGLEMAHRFGFGTGNRAEWIDHARQSLAADMFYVADRDVPGLFAGPFELVRHGEAEFMRDRLAQSARLRRLSVLVKGRSVEPVLRALALRLANGVYVFRRKP